MKNRFSTPTISFLANKVARRNGANIATEIQLLDGDDLATSAARGHKGALCGYLVKYDGYHAESRTGIRASMAALKRFWSTYHYVHAVCVVAVPDIEAIYNNDNH